MIQIINNYLDTYFLKITDQSANIQNRRLRIIQIKYALFIFVRCKLVSSQSIQREYNKSILIQIFILGDKLYGKWILMISIIGKLVK